MRKSKMNSRMGVLGGISPNIGIVPPAAAAAAHVNLPENDPVLQRLLSDTEIAAIKQQRVMESPQRNRQYDHAVQVQRDHLRHNMSKATQRRAKQAKSAASSQRSSGKAFKLGRAAPLNNAEEDELLGVSSAQGVLNIKEDLSPKQLQQFEEKWKKSVDSHLAQEIEAAKPRNMTRLPTEPAREAGGVSLVSNSIGVNPRPLNPSSPQRRTATPQMLQPSLAAIEKSSTKKTTKKATKKATTKKASKTSAKSSKK